MKKILSVILCAIMLFGASIPCFASDEVGTTYYIDAENGNDSASGKSERSAWKTLNAAASLPYYKEGDKILLKAGSVFDGSFNPKGSGTDENPITLGAYGDVEALGKPIIRSSADVVLIYINNVSNWKVENIEFTAPNGKGIYIVADGNKMTTNITISNCTFHDIWYKQCESYNGGHCPIMLTSSGAVSRLRDITISGCQIYDCAYGINMGGLTREWAPDLFVSPEESYNTGYTIENVDLNNILYDAIIIGSIYGMVIRDCSLINTSLNDDYFTAPMWSHHASNFVIENCEIAGAKNEKDGMAVDFDGWTTDATYQYIYSHDNYRFIRNCCYDNYTKNANCTVRYCLSVNDNKGENSMAQLLSSGSVDYAEDEKAVSMDNFKFYNNTLINCSEISCGALSNAFIANNIFVGNSITDTFLFTRKSIEDGKPYYTTFDGEFTNNCFRKINAPFMAEDNFFCDPGFVGTDENDKNSYMLSTDSKLIGKGIQVEKDMGEHDFYGNKLTASHNIGCYEGMGEAVQAKAGFFKTFSESILTMLAGIAGFIANCNNRYWIF